jgi:hypothetical protein
LRVEARYPAAGNGRVSTKHAIRHGYDGGIHVSVESAAQRPGLILREGGSLDICPRIARAAADEQPAAKTSPVHAKKTVVERQGAKTGDPTAIAYRQRVLGHRVSIKLHAVDAQ